MQPVVHGTGGTPRGGSHGRRTADEAGATLGLSAFLRATSTPTLVADAVSGRVLVANEPMAALLGVPATELAGRPAGWLLQDPEAASAVTEAVRSDQHVTLERRLRSRAAVRTGRVTTTPMPAADGRPAISVIQVADTSELWAALDQLTAERDALDSAAEHIAHDLKSPLTAIVGMAELMAQSESSGLIRAELAERIAANAHSAADIVSRMADEARQTCGPAVPLTRVQPLMAAIRTAMTVPVAEAGATVSLKAELDAVPIPAGVLRPLVTALVASALGRRVPERRLEVEVAVHQDGAYIRIEVVDNGRPMDVEDLDAVLRVGTGPRPGHALRSVAGSRALLRDLGGDLWAEPNDGAGGHGTRYVAVVPVTGTTGVDLDMSDGVAVEHGL